MYSIDNPRPNELFGTKKDELWPEAKMLLEQNVNCSATALQSLGIGYKRAQLFIETWKNLKDKKQTI